MKKAALFAILAAASVVVVRPLWEMATARSFSVSWEADMQERSGSGIITALSPSLMSL